MLIFSRKHGSVHLIPDSVNGDGQIKSDFLIYFNGIYSTERKAFVVRDTTQISNTTALLTAGKFLAEEENKFEENEGCDRSDVVLAIDGRKDIKFACLSRFL